MHPAHTLVVLDGLQTLFRLGVGAEPVHGVDFEAVGLVVRIARTVGDVVEGNPALVPVGEIFRDTPHGVGRQESDRLVVDRKATFQELSVIDASYRHQDTPDAAGVGRLFYELLFGNSPVFHGEVDSQHERHHQPQAEPYFGVNFHRDALAQRSKDLVSISVENMAVTNFPGVSLKMLHHLRSLRTC